MKRLIFISGLLMIVNCVFAQNLSFYGFLPSINQTGRISKKFNYNLFVSTTIDAIHETIKGVDYPATDMQFYFQPGIIYVHSPDLNITGSYVYQRNNPFNENFVNEHRLWQQVISSLPVSKGKLSNRFRFEERFIENVKTGKYPFSTRLRYQIGFNVPLQGRTLDKYEFYFNAYNEFYFSLTGAKNATFSENWTYSGCGYDFGKNGRIELGYLLQIAVRNKAQDLRFLNLMQVAWITNLNFSGAKVKK